MWPVFRLRTGKTKPPQIKLKKDFVGVLGWHDNFLSNGNHRYILETLNSKFSKNKIILISRKSKKRI